MKRKRFIVKRITGTSLASDLFEKAMKDDGHIVLGPNQEAITMSDGSTAIVDWTRLHINRLGKVTLTLGKPKKETET